MFLVSVILSIFLLSIFLLFQPLIKLHGLYQTTVQHHKTHLLSQSTTLGLRQMLFIFLFMDQSLSKVVTFFFYSKRNIYISMLRNPNEIEPTTGSSDEVLRFINR